MSVTCQHIELVIHTQRTHATDFQMAEFRLTLAGTPVAWDGSATITNPSGGASAAPEDPAKLIDGNTGTKCFASLAGDITFRVNNGVPITFDGFQYCTANDEPGRDAKDFDLNGSNLGSSFTNLATITNATGTDAVLIAATRNAWTGVFAASGTVSDGGAVEESVPPLNNVPKETRNVVLFS